MDVSLLIRLIDEFSAPAQKLANGIQKIGEVANEMKRELNSSFKEGFSVKNYEVAIKKAEQDLTRAKSKLIGAVGMGLALAAPIKSLGEFEDKLTDFGNVAGIFGDDLAEIGTALRELGPQVNKSASEMLSALEYLVGKGIDPDTAITALQSIGMTATATKSSIEDMAASGFAAIDNLQVPAENLQSAFDAMAVSGKKGGFELKGMAAYFPQLTASARALKMEGVPAIAELSAALQIAMKGAGDESTAANNLQNFLSKLTSRETTANFKKLGINLETEFEKAADRGVSAFEHMIAVIYDATNGGDQFRLNELFGDEQVKAFLRPMLSNLDEYRDIRDAALSADGINFADFERNTQTLVGAIKSLSVQLNNLTAAGSPLLDVAKQITGQLTLLISQVNALSMANPELASGIVLTTAALAGFSIASRLVAYGVAAIRLPIIGLAKAFFMFDEAGVNVAKGWRMLAATGSILSTVFRLAIFAASAAGAAIAGVTAPIWAVVAAIVAAVVAIGFVMWKYWDRISAFTSGFVAPVTEALSGVVNAMGEAVNGITSKISEMTGIDPETVRAYFARLFDFSGVINGAKSMLDGFWQWLGSVFSQEKLSDATKGEMQAAGRALGQALVDGVKAGAVAIWDWFAQWPRMALAAIGTIDLSSIFNWGEPPSWLNWLPGVGGGNKQPLASLSGANAPLNMETKTTIAASVTDNRPPTVNVDAHFVINGATDAKTVGREVKSQLGGAISNARTGALHGGTE